MIAKSQTTHYDLSHEEVVEAIIDYVRRTKPKTYRDASFEVGINTISDATFGSTVEAEVMVCVPKSAPAAE